MFNLPLERMDRQNSDIISDDLVIMSLQSCTQWDCFAHVGSWFDADGDGRPEKVVYNGYRGDTDICGPKRYDALAEGGMEHGCGEDGGARQLGIENFAVKGMQGRGVAANLRAHGRSRCFLTAPPLRLPGAVGSPATSIATV